MEDIPYVPPEQMVQTNESLYIDTTCSEANIHLENASFDTGQTKKLAFGCKADENCARSKSQLQLETQKQSKIQKIDTEINLRKKSFNEIIEEITTMKKDQYVDIVRENSPKFRTTDHNFKLNRDESKITYFNTNSHVLESIPPRNHPFGREVIRLSNCILYLEMPSCYFSTRDKPPGCRTIFVCGLPQNITKELITEIFERCGQLQAVIIPEIGFCYVTFCNESSVDRAISFSGYRLIIYNMNETSYTGILYIDYAGAEFDEDCSHNPDEKDFTLFSCPNISKTRFDENQLKDNIEVYRENESSKCNLEDIEGQSREGSFGPITLFVHNAAFCICEMLNREETFSEAVNILKSYLDKEKCSEKDASSVFSMIQCFHNHLMKILSNNYWYENKLKHEEAALVDHFKEIMHRLVVAEKVYSAGSLEQCCDHFTPAERKNIEQWKRSAKKLRSKIKKKVNELDHKEKADRNKRNVQFFKEMSDKIEKLKEELRSLKHGCKELQNNIKMLKLNYKKDFEHLDFELAVIQNDIKRNEKRKLKLKEKFFLNKIQIRELSSQITHEPRNEDNSQLESVTSSSDVIRQHEAYIIGLVAIFLRTHPGADTSSIYSYLHENGSTINYHNLETTLQKFPSVFLVKVTGVGVNMKKEWYFKYLED